MTLTDDLDLGRKEEKKRSYLQEYVSNMIALSLTIQKLWSMLKVFFFFLIVTLIVDLDFDRRL